VTTTTFAPTVDVDLSQPLAWPNPDGTTTIWPPEHVGVYRLRRLANWETPDNEFSRGQAAAYAHAADIVSQYLR
jgi:hypothetical protein